MRFCRNRLRHVTLRRVQRGKDIGKRLRDLRKAARLTQEQLGERASMKRTEVSAHERGKRVGDAVGARLAAALGITVEELFGPPSESVEASKAADRRLDDLLAVLEERAEGVDGVVAEVLQLLTRRLRLAEQRLARADRRARGA